MSPKTVPPGAFRPAVRGPLAAPTPPGISPSANTLVRAGLEAHRAGRLDAAEQLYARALRTQPDHPDALNLSGTLALVRGRNDLAIQFTRRAVKAQPAHLGAYLRLAEALEKSMRAPEAIAVCRKAVARSPEFAEGHARLAKLLADAGDNAGAVDHAKAALARAPGSIEALCALGLGLRRLSKIGEADEAYREALRMAPDDVGALAGYAALLNETGDTELAARLYRRAIELRPHEPMLLAGLARVLERDDDLIAAMALYDQAITTAPGSADLLYRRGACLRDLGNFDAAATAFRKALAASPDNVPALLALARIRRLPDTVALRRQLGRIVAAPTLDARNRAQAGFAFGEILDAAGEPDAAFSRFAEANRMHRHHHVATGQPFDRAALTDLVDSTDRRLAADYAGNTASWANPSELPVFVVGMPRSGTTLVEQICASHSRVVGAGELRGIQTAYRAIGAHNQGRDRLGEWDADFARAQADRHAAQLRRLGGGALRVVDKTPMNLTRLGLIGALYPKARVIWCRRDPRDVVVSNQLMFFARGNLYSTDQSDCAFATRQIDRFGEIWRRELKLPILEVVYEDLVADLDTNVRRIIDFLGVPWETTCLDFHTTERGVTTPSTWQVRQPIYSSSVGRWRRYEKHLEPMLTALEDAG